MLRAGIIHFATYNVIDLSDPKVSGLYFAIDSSQMEDGILQNRELYNIELQAGLIVMSACESGLGKTIPGEGIIGLSRGFLYSGCQYIMVSL